MTHFEKEILRLLAMMNDKIEAQTVQIDKVIDGQEDHRDRLIEVECAVVSVGGDVAGLRDGVMEQVNKDGQVILRHQRSIQELDGRVRKLEVA